MTEQLSQAIREQLDDATEFVHAHHAMKARYESQRAQEVVGQVVATLRSVEAWLTPLELGAPGAIWRASFSFVRVAEKGCGANRLGQITHSAVECPRGSDALRPQTRRVRIPCRGIGLTFELHECVVLRVAGATVLGGVDAQRELALLELELRGNVHERVLSLRRRLIVLCIADVRC
jgi:hypothetical protein